VVLRSAPQQLKRALDAVYWRVVDRTPDPVAIRLAHLRHFHRLPRLSPPRTFNEKLHWRKLHQRDPRFVTFSDKIAAKPEIARLIGEEHIIPTLWTGDDPADIPFDTLEPPYVIKAAHSSGGNVFVRDDAPLDRPAIVADLREQLAFDHSHRYREWGYRGVPRRVIVERMLDTVDGEPPEDYKFYVFHGRTHYIEVHRDRFNGHSISMYDRDGNWLPALPDEYAPATPDVLPDDLLEMRELAERIGREFDFVRVDLYTTPNGIFFGETTLYPCAGVLPFRTYEWDLDWGAPWHLG
jgi:hypothetical protein